MALADLVLEGLTLILAIALGLVLIGGLTYLTITVSTTNNARLAYTGLYIYLPQPIYVNGTLYIPMYNIGYYRAVVKYVYVKGIDGSIHEYAPNLVLGVNQYYVYTLSLGYEPTSITVLASPMDYPGIIKEFSVNVSTVNSIPLIPQSQSQPSSGLIDVTVNDPYNAGWEVTWSYAGQSYSVSQAQSYTWFINPPYVPIQISFTASITSTPNGYYQCQVVPSRVANTYNAGSVQEFNVFCYSVVIQVNDPYGAGWSIGLTPPSGLSWSGSSTQTIYVNQTLNYPQSVSASITSIPPGYQSCSITGPTQITGPGTYTYNVQCQGGVQVYLSVTFTPYKSYVCTYYVSGDALLQYPNGTQKYYYIFFTTTTTTTKTYYLYNGPPGVTVKSIDIDYTSSTLYNANCGDSETQSYNPNPPVTFGINGVYTIYGNVAATSSSSNSGSSGYAEFYLTVNAPSGYSWTVTASGAVSESASGTGPVSNSWWFSIHPTNSPIYFSASKGCTVSPSTITPSSAGNYYVTVNCGGSSSSGSISVSVQDSYGGAGWSVSWSGGASGSKSGSSSASWSITASGTVDFTALITSNPSSYTCTISPTSTSANPGGSVTFTVSCTSNNQPPPSKYYCIVKPSAGDNVGGASGAYVSPSGTQYLSPGQSELFTWGIQYNIVTYQGQTYYFNNWVVTLNGQAVTTSQYSGVGYTFTCPSNLGSNQTYTLSGTAYYYKRYLTVGGGTTINAPGNGTYALSSVTTAYFTWQDPEYISGSWSITYTPGSTSLTISVTLTDYYSQSGTAPQLSASTTLDVSSPSGYNCNIVSVSPTSGSTPGWQESNWLPNASVTFQCNPSSKYH